MKHGGGKRIERTRGEIVDELLVPGNMKSGQTPAPITGTPFHVHHSHNPDVFRFFHEDYRVRKIAAEMPARGRIKFAESFRVGADFAKQTLQLAEKTHAEFRRNPGIIANRSGKFLDRFGMKQMIHSPAILRARASDSSSGTPLTFPDSISAMRRSVSAFHDSATDD